jgi:uncharacterized iron-regulated membrane protein
MGKILDRLISWFLSALTIIVLLTLVYLGWYNYLFGGIFLVAGIVLVIVSIHMLTQSMRGRLTFTNPFEPPPSSRKQTVISIILGILALAGDIDLTKSNT